MLFKTNLLCFLFLYNVCCGYYLTYCSFHFSCVCARACVRLCVCVFVWGFHITCRLFPNLYLIKLIQMETLLFLSPSMYFQPHHLDLVALMLISLSISLYSNTTISDGEGTAMMQAKPRTQPSSRLSMSG